MRAYLQLIRPANVVTATADVLAGFAVAGLANANTLVWLLISTSCLYAGGVVLNDVFDRAIDAVERPERPIPSGRASVQGAASLGAALLVVGLAAAAVAGQAAFVIAAAIALLAVVYDAWGKHVPVVGPINMGLCRGLNLLLGVAATPAALAASWPLALIGVTYIGAVTLVSQGEVAGGRRPALVAGMILVASVSAALFGVAIGPGHASVGALVLVLVFARRVLRALWAAYRDPLPLRVRHAVRTGVLSLVLVDAVIGASYAGMIYSLTILATAVVAVALARLFAVT